MGDCVCVDGEGRGIEREGGLYSRDHGWHQDSV